jgi:hypothetical protein
VKGSTSFFVENIITPVIPMDVLSFDNSVKSLETIENYDVLTVQSKDFFNFEISE